MKKFNLAMAVLVGAVLLSGCKLNQMIKLAQENDLKVDPNPLEVHGGNVPFEMSAVLPPKILPSNTSFTLNTIYVYGDQEVAVGSVEFTAADFPNSKSNTSTKVENFTFPYQEGMNPGTLYIQGVATDLNNGKTKTTDRLAVAQGLVLTSQWVTDVVMASYADPGYSDEEELVVPTNVNFYFDQGRSNLRTDLSYDGKTNKEKRESLSAFIAEKNITKTVIITGTHSPEGTETINSDLSKDRAATIQSFYVDRMKRYDYKGMADSIEFIQKPVVQDWTAFKAALEAYEGIDADEKSKYTNIINGTGTFIEKEKEMQTLSSYKKVFNDVYPGLRSAKTEVLTAKPKKSNAEIAVLSKAIVEGTAEADTLTTEELMFSATLTPSLEEKAAIYKAAADKSGIWQAHNNLAAVHIELAQSGDMSKLDGATTQLEIAMNKEENAVVKVNMGAVQVLQGNYEEAYATLSDVSGDNMVNAKVAAMKGALEVRMSKYDEAKASFASAEMNDDARVDKGLAHLLSRDYSMADAEFNQVQRADAYYLLAVSAARQNNAANVASNLKKAVDAEPSYKDKAMNDLEFKNYADAVSNAVK